MRLKKYLSCLLGVAMLSGQIMAGSATATEKKEERGTEEYIVQAATEKQYEKLLDQYEEQISAEDAEKETLEEAKILPMTLTEKEADKLDEMRNVVIEENAMLSAEGETEAYREGVRKLIQQRWNRKAVGMDQTTDEKERDGGTEGRKIRLAVLDSGIDPVESGGVAEAANLTEEDAAEGQAGDSTGHGTAIANIIKQDQGTSAPGGLLPAGCSVELISVKVLDENNQSPISRVIEALEWCLAHEIDVVNMSFGMEDASEILHGEMERLAQEGILMIAAAGNSGEKQDKRVEYPAAYPEVIAVGAVNQKMQKSIFSAEGREIELTAPGEDIPIIPGWGLQGVGSGTSFAAPHAAAAAALLWSRYPEKKAEDIRELLKQSAEIPDGAPTDAEKLGSGIVNFQNALFLMENGWKDTRSELPAQNVQGGKEADNGCQSYEIPQVVQGSWAYNHHQHLIGTHGGTRAIGEGDRHIVRIVSYYVDMNDDTKKFNVLHARGQTNYVSATYCLFEAARRWGGSIKTEEQLEKWMKNYKSTVPDTDKNNGRKIAIQQMVTTAKTATTRKIEGADSFDMNNKKYNKYTKSDKINWGRLQLLGFAIHLAGDVYAHKAMCVPENFIELANKKHPVLTGKRKGDYYPRDYMINGNAYTIHYKLMEGNTTTAGLGKTYFDGKFDWLCNQVYTDSINFMPQRYNVAVKNATNYLLKNYCNNVAFSCYTFCPYEVDTGYHYKTKYLTKYLTQTVDGFYNKYNKYSKEKWQALSHD